MKIDKDTLVILYFIMESLAKGKNPLSDLELSQNDMENSEFLRKTFLKSAQVFKMMLDSTENDGIIIQGKRGNHKLPFYILDKEWALLRAEDEEITISRFVFSINEKISRDRMKKLQAKDITAWLVMNEYLEEAEDEDGEIYKVATENGRIIGIRSVYKRNSIGKQYVTNLYSKNAQEFLLTEVLPQMSRIVELEIL